MGVEFPFLCQAREIHSPLSCMKRICILGSVALAEPLINEITGSHEIYVVSEEYTHSDQRRFRVIPGTDNISVPIDLVIDLIQEFGDQWTTPEMYSEGSCVLVNSVQTTATRVAGTNTHLVERGVGFAALSYLPGIFETSTSFEISIARQCTDSSGIADLLNQIFSSRSIELVEDSIGHVSPRIVATVINEAAFAVMEGVASPIDIDAAMKLGVNYPEGPLKWADRIGATNVTRLLDLLWEEYHDERYRVARILRDHAISGATFLS